MASITKRCKAALFSLSFAYLVYLLSLLFLALPSSVQAQFTYTTNNDQITITGDTNIPVNGVVAIPSTILVNGIGLTVTSIGDYAFADTSVTSVTIPNSITNIGYRVFDDCTNLIAIAVDNFNSFYSSIAGVLFNKGQTTLITCPAGKPGSYTVPNSVTSFGDFAFTCPSLTNVTIGSGVTNIGNETFSDCSSLIAITVDASNYYYTSVDGVLFTSSQATLVECPVGKAGSFTIPDGVTSIGNYAFEYCFKLNNVTIPDSVTSIGDSAFFGCDLTNVMIGNGVTSIGNLAFFGCPMTIVTIPGSVTTIGNSAFCQCLNLTSITIPNSVTDIEDAAFSYCSSLTNITFPDSVSNIADYLLGNCTSLTKITIPDTVTSIGNAAFGGCTSLTNIMIPASVTSIGVGPFEGCTGLATITVDALNSFYVSTAGVLFDKSQATLIQYPASKTGSYTIPASVTSIGDFAFYQCVSLTSISIPNSVTNMGDYAFYQCVSLTSISIPNSVTSIGVFAFCQCLNLTSITIPNSVTSIVDYAFSYCSELTSVYFQGNAPSLGSEVFFVDNDMTIYYLPGTTGWGNFSSITGLPIVLWNPQAQNDASFGVQNNQFGFNITGSSNLVIVVEASTNLANPIWISVATNTLTAGSSYFNDPQWTNYPTRFYRFSSP